MRISRPIDLGVVRLKLLAGGGRNTQVSLRVWATLLGK